MDHKHLYMLARTAGVRIQKIGGTWRQILVNKKWPVIGDDTKCQSWLLSIQPTTKEAHEAANVKSMDAAQRMEHVLSIMDQPSA